MITELLLWILIILFVIYLSKTKSYIVVRPKPTTERPNTRPKPQPK